MYIDNNTGMLEIKRSILMYLGLIFLVVIAIVVVLMCAFFLYYSLTMGWISLAIGILALTVFAIYGFYQFNVLTYHLTKSINFGYDYIEFKDDIYSYNDITTVVVKEFQYRYDALYKINIYFEDNSEICFAFMQYELESIQTVFESKNIPIERYPVFPY